MIAPELTDLYQTTRHVQLENSQPECGRARRCLSLLRRSPLSAFVSAAVLISVRRGWVRASNLCLSLQKSSRTRRQKHGPRFRMPRTFSSSENGTTAPLRASSQCRLRPFLLRSSPYGTRQRQSPSHLQKDTIAKTWSTAPRVRKSRTENAVLGTSCWAWRGGACERLVGHAPFRRRAATFGISPRVAPVMNP